MSLAALQRTAIVAFVVVAALCAWGRVMAARPIQGAVGEVPPADGAALGAVGFRVWSALPGGETSFNDNTASCRNVRCLRNYVTNTILNPGGYVGPSENTVVYNGDLEDQPFYELADSSMNDGAANHIGYYGVSGVTANNVGVGYFLYPDCSGVTASNCFLRIDANDAAPPLLGTYAAYGGAPNTIRAIGGLNPIPNVRIDAIDAGGVAHLSWNDPPTYAANMRPSNSAPAPPSPVLGVRLWKNLRSGNCDPPVGNDPGWTSVGTFDLGETSTQVALGTGAECYFFALTVRLIGPGGLPNEVETFRVGVSSFPALAPCVEGHACASDFDPCTLDICVSGDCAHLPDDVAACDDDNACTDDFCSGEICQHVPNSATVCDDGNACTLVDTCANGACVSGSPKDCSDGNICTDDSCNTSSGACLHANNSAFCDGGNVCTSFSQCSGGSCAPTTPPDCSDTNICTNDACVAPVGCVHTFNTAPCSDGNACTLNDHCTNGFCIPASFTNCDDGNQCTSDSCNVSSGGCLHTNASWGCDDGDPCTAADVCSSGVCVAGPSVCSDGNDCTFDICLPGGGCRYTIWSGACSDGDGCTIGDSCSGGTCGGTPITAPSEVVHDRFVTKTVYSWDAEPNAAPGTVYDVVGGACHQLPPGTGPDESCRIGGTSQTSLEVNESPLVGEASWYLVRARNTCGNGSWGSGSNGVPRTLTACP